MPEPQRICPACHTVAGTADSYCSSCGKVLARSDSPTGHRATPDLNYVPLVIARPESGDPLPLLIVPNPWRQRRKILKRTLALLATVAVAGLFALTLFLIGDNEHGVFIRAVAIGSGLLTAIALASWVNFGIRRAKKRPRRQEWRMSVS
ncbi:MAG: hypothetical protein H0V37_11410 [Chloroflexia bacterium]|nr:hypothetical protein [Chloroflexia bacterium]